LNHRVSNRRMSCKLPDLPFRKSAPPSAMLRKNPEIAGATCLFAAAWHDKKESVSLVYRDVWTNSQRE
jgi:hypothetical protein